MTDNRQDVVFLEFGSHADAFHSHFLFLKDRFNIHLIVNEKIVPFLTTSVPLASVQKLRVEGRTPLSVSLEVRRIVERIRPALVFFHTAQGNIVRELCFLLPRKYPAVGVHHNADKLIPWHSFSQRLISLRLRHYFVLADYIKENLAPLVSPKIRLQEVYTIYYERPPGFREILKTKPLRVAVPGAVEQSRRDFRGLAEALWKTPLNDRVEIAVLGDGSRGEGPALRRELRAAGLETSFTFFDGYLSEADMVSYLASSDLIMPLLHPGMPYFPLFEKYKISGSYNLAYGYQKPLLMHQRLAGKKEFKPVALGYEMEELAPSLNRLAQDPSPLTPLAQNIKTDPRLDFRRQQKLYDAFIQSALGQVGPEAGKG